MEENNTKPNQPEASTNASQPDPTPPPTPTPEPSHDVSKKPKALITTAIICAILAVAGIAASIYFYIDANNKAAEIANLQSKLDLLKEETGAELVEKQEDDTTITTIEVTSDATISNELAQSIVDPYLKNFQTFTNLLDYGLNDETKVEVAYLNLDPQQIHSVTMQSAYAIDTVNVYYDSLNKECGYLFGKDTEVAKRDYDPGKTNRFTYANDGPELFKVAPFYGGGTGGSMISKVKTAYKKEDNLIVEVYHDTVPWCAPESSEDEYCTETRGSITEDFISKHGDEIPVYKMIFSKDSDHYVLTDIQKQ